VVVRDLSTGRVLHKVPTGSPVKSNPYQAGVGPVVALVVKANGSVAWIAEDVERSMNVGSSEVVPYFDVWEADKTGSRLLASGFDVDPSSLALAGSTLYWTQGGKPFSASLN
jgi:hypothetical protein